MRAKERQRIIERALHRLCFARTVLMDAAEVRLLLDAFQGWADAHRDGNGERSERDIQRAVDKALLRLEQVLAPANSAHATLDKAAALARKDPLVSGSGQPPETD
jgi:hypothetical protein